MPVPTPEQVIENLKGPGLFIVKGSSRYFIPLSVFSDYALPPEFQSGSVGVSQTYFEFAEGSTPAQRDQLNAGDSPVAKGLEDILREFWATDGVRQAVWLDVAIQPDGKKASKAEGSRKVLFTFNNDGTKIIVDASKGGRPSNR